jgi:hypothetical protein
MIFLSYMGIFVLGFCIGSVSTAVIIYLEGRDEEDDDDWEHHDLLDEEEDPEEHYL